ncbi:PKD domain-containing protein [Tenacibaculum jejuense]|uniref:PKD domain containing protein n=1 Tax=Tenacibaculum jejuense TaxID=584609 RepID=A0A238U6C9_9FLAO|nr:PKD domain-containing protein [Tenacibaculum jejuense]SNR14556.1 PKD domain containing protein [Tenacibaculum jejuense]
MKTTSLKLKFSVFILLSILLVSCYKETAITVNSSFDVSYVNGDKSVPVAIKVSNKTEGADQFEWTFEGGNITASSERNPQTIIYNEPGTYTITLKATNVDGEEDIFEKQIAVLEAIDINFSTNIIENNFSPVTVEINNQTIGDNLTYEWTFERGLPNSSSERNPQNIVFREVGEHTIQVKVSNGFETVEKTKTIEVLPELKVDFDWELDRFDDDAQAPVNITLNNKSTSALTYSWTFTGGIPATSTEENPKVLFSSPGTHAIKLEASNGKETKTETKLITVIPNTNLRTFENIELGINIAHNTNTKGAFFSSELRKTLKANEVTAENGSKIDIAFLGLNSSFSFNKFISPTEVATNGFVAIPNATETKIINSLENCNCGINFSESQFDTMVNDQPLQNLTITTTSQGSLHFDATTIPRIVLFQTEDGRKGAIKIKEFVANGNDSYMVCDIKIQKLP